MQIIVGKKNHRCLFGNSSKSRKLEQFPSRQERFQNLLGTMVTLPCPIHLSRTTWIRLVQKRFQVSFYLWRGNVWLGLSWSWLQWLSTIKKFSGKLSMLLRLQSLDWLTFKNFSAVRGQAGILRSFLMIHFSYMQSIAIITMVCKSPAAFSGHNQLHFWGSWTN